MRGIGPAYVDKYARTGIRMADLLDVDQFRAKLAPALAQKNRMITQIYGQPPLSLEEIHTEYCRLRAAAAPLHRRYRRRMLQQASTMASSILLEGAQGALLDVDFGTYPFVTSSSTVAGNASTGAGLPPRSIAPCARHLQSLHHARRQRPDADGAFQRRGRRAARGRP